MCKTKREETKGIHSGEEILIHNVGRCIYKRFTTGALIPVRNPDYGGKVRYGYNCPYCGKFVPASFSLEDQRKLDIIYKD